MRSPKPSRPARATSGLGDLERAVMEVLWSTTDAENWTTVREVHAVIGAERDIAYTTVMTVMDRLARKGAVLQQKEGRAYHYRAAATRGAMTAELMRETLADLGEGSRESALVAFVADASADDIAALKQALAELEDS
ncbi:BlaI/MecI/CopY family transcriptional regulator [Nocardioides sp. AE5]|uniref:BlaI/MecI/CopY family transcriptional regulator n=1 Tax=Nocardioides sp. AE5 TaxID=2962573 RepID=UPI002881F12C|nr:BlaI/MecI/CopY family transcriptional regulator [Nocardioides sp. AE5]MDT0201775.1 BlaI/MecI/CopY family transcriptional regulator [Nocardioides sp. AE5]